jgi:hypothetical protein
LLEQREEYEAFEQQMFADYDPRSVVEHQLVARLASLLWRLRRATLIETGLFTTQLRAVLRRRREAQAKFEHPQLGVLYRMLQDRRVDSQPTNPTPVESLSDTERVRKTDPAAAFFRLSQVNPAVIERLGRYESMLWRQLAQTMIIVEAAQKNRLRTASEQPVSEDR